MKLTINHETLLQRFSAYVGFETTSNPESTSFPSTAQQLKLADFLEQELQKLGFSDVQQTKYGYVLATIPANVDGPQPVIGLVAHMDTSREASGKNVKVEVHQNYQGGDLQLSEGIVLSPQVFPELLQYVGQDLITSDGTTLLGADDKAGICAIVTAGEYLLQHPEIKHGKLRIAFTPDEEVGRGTEHFPLAEFGADFAYTVDGGALGELNFETFNAYNLKVKFHGVSVHTGSAKGKMRNALKLAAEWLLELPPGEAPEYTEKYEGFYHANTIKGGVDHVEMGMILRDHDKNILAKRQAYLEGLAAFMNQKYGAGTVELEPKGCYHNMREFIEPVFDVVKRAQKAMQAQGIEPLLIPIRGGTDGAMLSEQGLPCPNLFTGGHNFHGRMEYLPLQSLAAITKVLVELVQA